MCGICGLWDLGGGVVDLAELTRMRDSMIHRGPDGAGSVIFDTRNSCEPVWLERSDVVVSRDARYQARGDLGLGHRRLSIIDLSTGDQPMCNEDGTVWIVYNGEIYNYRELRQELQSRGHIFRSTSDTEVVVHAYEEYGERCPSLLNGIFAFAIWDAQRRRLYLARDQFGVKPLYYRRDGHRLSFGSELKAILSDPTVSRALDPNALNLCLTFRHTPSPWTLFKGIYKLPPGSSLVVTTDSIRVQRYAEDLDAIDRRTSEGEWIDRLRAALEEAVVRQMVSDVPIGISLSSGVDSTTLLAVMSQHSRGPVRAFTVGFAGLEATSEVEPARQCARQFGAEFYQQIVAVEDYAAFMSRYLWHLEEPIGNESAAAYYFVAEMARQRGVKVLLNGQGADEAFAGYRRYVGPAYADWLRLAAVPPLSRVVPRLLGGTALGERYRRFVYALDGTSEVARVLRTHSILTEETKRQLLRPDVLARLDLDLPADYVRDQLSRVPEGTPLERMTYLDARTSLPDNLLLCEDKMAMAASVEARVPYLDLQLMAIAERIPGKFKLRRLRNKYIHREACERWVTPRVAARPQIGFDNAVDRWLRAQLGDRLRRIVSSSDSFTSAYLDPHRVRRLMQEHVEGRRDHQRILFLLLSLESWHEVFFRATVPAEAVTESLAP